MLNDLDLVSPMSLRYFVASHKKFAFRTYNRNLGIFIYNEINEIMSIILAVTNDLDLSSPRSSVHLIV